MQLPEPDLSRELLARYAAIRAIVATELDRPRLVLPTSEFFPDRFEPSEAGIARILKRMQSHAGILDVPVRPQIAVDADASAESGKSCGTGGCAPQTQSALSRPRVEDAGDTWLINLSPAETTHPVGLTTLLARSLSAIFFEEVRGTQATPAPAEVSYDLTGVALGYGVLLMEGAHVYSKSCGGPSIARLTALGVGDFALLTAFFAAQYDADTSAAKRCLSATQKAIFSDAVDLAKSNSSLVRKLGSAPASLASGDFVLEEARAPWFGRFNKKRERSDEEMADALLSGELADADVRLFAAKRDTHGVGPGARAQTSGAGHPDDELKRLVSESLSESRAG